MKMANKKSSNIRIVAVVLLSVTALLLSLIAITGKAPAIKLSLSKGGEVCDGVLPGIEEHITSVPEGEIRYLINKRMVFEDSYSLGAVMLENPESCEYDLKFSVYNSAGELIYASPMLKPGQYIEKDKLAAVVKAGEYACSYSAQAYKDEKAVGQVTGIVTVVVG